MRSCTLLLTATALAAGVLTAPQLSRAEPPPPENDFTRDGWYVQAQAAYAVENFKNFSVDNGWGFNTLAGWRFWRMFGAEVEIEFINDLAGRGGDPSYQTFNFAVMPRIYPLARLFDPGSMANRFQPWLKAGPSWQWVNPAGPRDKNRGDFAGRFGAGLDTYITENWVFVLSANYQLTGFDVSDYPYLSAGAGIQYRFGGGD